MRRICCKTRSEQLISLASGDLSGSERRDLEAHVAKCWPCYHTLAEDRRLTKLIRDARPVRRRQTRTPRGQGLTLEQGRTLQLVRQHFGPGAIVAPVAWAARSKA